MRKSDKYLSFSCYKYAPESFKAYKVIGFKNGNKNIPLYEEVKLTLEDNNKCGYAYATKGKNEAISELKKVIRKQERQASYRLTVGFKINESKSQCAYCQALNCKQYDLKSLLRIYKEFKNDMLSRDCKIADITEAKLGANYKVIDVVKNHRTVNINAPVIVKLHIV